MYTTQLLLDKQSSNYIRELWGKLSINNIDSTMNNINEIHPHITFAVYDDINIEKFIEILKKFQCEIKPIIAEFDTIGCFPSTNTSFISPTVTSEMLELHKKYYECFCEFNINAKGYYFPNRWVPHCSLTMGTSKEASKQSMLYIYDIFQPFKATLDKIALYKVEHLDDGKINSIRLF